jgi:hypothetical protein
MMQKNRKGKKDFRRNFRWTAAILSEYGLLGRLYHAIALQGVHSPRP